MHSAKHDLGKESDCEEIGGWKTQQHNKHQINAPKAKPGITSSTVVGNEIFCDYYLFSWQPTALLLPCLLYTPKAFTLNTMDPRRVIVLDAKRLKKEKERQEEEELLRDRAYQRVLAGRINEFTLLSNRITFVLPLLRCRSCRWCVWRSWFLSKRGGNRHSWQFNINVLQATTILC